MASAKAMVTSVLGWAVLLASPHVAAMQDLPKIKVGDTVLLAGPARFIDEDSLGQYQNGSCTLAEQAEADAQNKKAAAAAKTKGDTTLLLVSEAWRLCVSAGFEAGFTLRSTWMQHVEVKEIRGSLIRYRPYGNHPLPGWADVRGLMTPEQFAPLNEWRSPGSYRFCVQSHGCFELAIESDASASLSQLARADGHCKLKKDKQTGVCRATGQLALANNILRFPDGSESGMFFSINPKMAEWDPHSMRMYGIGICPVEFGAYTFTCSDDAFSAVFFEPKATDGPGKAPTSTLE